MQSELIAQLNYIAAERGINPENLLLLLSDSFIVAARKSGGPCDDMEVSVDPKTGDVHAIARVTVVPRIVDSATEMDWETAKTRYPECDLGDYIDWEIQINDFGRVAAQTFRQALITRLSQEEKRIACEEFADKVGTLIYGEVNNVTNNGDVYVSFGKVEGILPRNEMVYGEKFAIGKKVMVYLKEIDPERQKSGLVLSRKDPRFVACLFEREVAEIDDKLIEIKGISREAGSRTKMAVQSTNSDIDPVGACVGMHGSRIKSVIRELNGEKIDVIVWSPNLEQYVRNAMQPAELQTVTLDHENHVIKITAREDQYSLAIGKKGQNVSLASRLLDWKIDVSREESKGGLELSFEEQLNKAITELTAITAIDETIAKLLVNAGFLSISGLKAANFEDLSTIEGISKEKTQAILDEVAEKFKLS